MRVYFYYFFRLNFFPSIFSFFRGFFQPVFLFFFFVFLFFWFLFLRFFFFFFFAKRTLKSAGGLCWRLPLGAVNPYGSSWRGATILPQVASTTVGLRAEFQKKKRVKKKSKKILQFLGKISGAIFGDSFGAKKRGFRSRELIFLFFLSFFFYFDSCFFFFLVRFTVFRLFCSRIFMLFYCFSRFLFWIFGFFFFFFFARR